MRTLESSSLPTASSFSQLKQYFIYSYAQFWFWGQDLAHHKQQTFIAYGFKRFPPPSDTGGKSMYLLSLSHGRFLCLWAYGLLIGECGKRAVFLRRGSFKLQITEEVILNLPDEYMTFESLRLNLVKGDSASVRLWWQYQSELISTILNYESWIFSQMGPAYRPTCLKRWRHKKFELNTVVPTLMGLKALGRTAASQNS